MFPKISIDLASAQVKSPDDKFFGKMLRQVITQSLISIAMNPAVTNEPSDKTLEAMRHFSETYAKNTDTFFCVDLSVTAVVIKGLAKNKEELGSPLCPCRHYEDKEAEVKAAFWNCPCVPMRERKECHCMLFLTPDNDFAGEAQEISLEEVKAV
jgi:ferredoxin-thioredoxin reductase catalytic chain